MTPEQRQRKLHLQRLWRKANPEKQRQYYLSSRRTPEAAREACRRWYWKKKATDPDFAAKNAEKVRLRKAKSKEIDPRKALLSGARQRAKKRGRPCTIALDDIVIPRHCPYLGLELRVSKGALARNSPSLDEVVCGLGYVPGNVEVISLQANTMKSDATPKQLRRMARVILKRIRERK